MEVKELRKKTEEELIKLLKLTQEQFRDLRFQVMAKQHKDVRDLRQVKKDIAKIKTILKEKEVLKAIKK
ncbi:MAG: 50S ribosomal protein L29 [bacterium]|nr:50S ribosomal protein L29 [bacterium]